MKHAIIAAALAVASLGASAEVVAILKTASDVIKLTDRPAACPAGWHEAFISGYRAEFGCWENYEGGIRIQWDSTRIQLIENIVWRDDPKGRNTK